MSRFIPNLFKQTERVASGNAATEIPNNERILVQTFKLTKVNSEV